MLREPFAQNFHCSPNSWNILNLRPPRTLTNAERFTSRFVQRLTCAICQASRTVAVTVLCLSTPFLYSRLTPFHLHSKFARVLVNLIFIVKRWKRMSRQMPTPYLLILLSPSTATHPPVLVGLSRTGPQHKGWCATAVGGTPPIPFAKIQCIFICICLFMYFGKGYKG